jgi:hypothetical protein
MFYMMPSPLIANVFQSWVAATRDQATVQLIANLSMQKAMQSDAVRNLEACTLMVEEQVDAVYESATQPRQRT